MLKIETGVNNKILRKKAAPLKKVDGAVKKLIKEMLQSIKEEKGIGLAAPQIGESIRLILIHLNFETEHAMIIPMINPEIVSFSEESCMAEEGCLSIPDKFINVARASEITVTFMNKKNQKQTLLLSDMNARVVQHEVDHLDGILMVDRETL